MSQSGSVRKRMKALDGTSFRFERKAQTLLINDLPVRSLTCTQDIVELVTEQKAIQVSAATYWEMQCDDLVPTRLLAGTILAKYDALVSRLQRITSEQSQEQEKTER